MVYHDKAIEKMREAEKLTGPRVYKLKKIREEVEKFRNYEATMEGIPELDKAADSDAP